MNKNTREMKLQAEGITCSSCAKDMENILRDKDGIIDVTVRFADETIDIRYDTGVIDRKQVFIAARKLGYKVKIIHESPAE